MCRMNEPHPISMFKCKNATIRVWSVIHLCMEGFKNNLAQVFVISRRHVARENNAPISKVKVTLAVSVFISLKDFNIIGHKCLAYLDDMSLERTMPLFVILLLEFAKV